MYENNRVENKKVSALADADMEKGEKYEVNVDILTSLLCRDGSS